MDAMVKSRWAMFWRAVNIRARAIFAALYPCRFALLAVLVPALALIGVPQLQECLRALAERTQFPEWEWIQWAAAFAAALYWAANAWYWTRQLLTFRFAPHREQGAVFERAQTYLPRLIGAGALTLFSCAIFHAGQGYHTVDEGRFSATLDRAALVAFLLAVVFYLFVHFRRRLFSLAKVEDLKTVVKARELPSGTKVVLAVSAAITIGFFFCAWLAPHAVAPRVGTIAILLIAAAAWCTAGSVAVFADGRYGLPVLPLACAALVLFSPLNDNHELRGSDAVAAKRDTLKTYTEDWLAARAADASPEQPYPVVVVATAGGGIRAAYWTGSLLAALEDRYGTAFGEHTFAISGVSGGSLGAATYVALRADRLESGGTRTCYDDPARSLQVCASAVLSQDFLAPVVAGMLFPDLVQRFLPVPFQSLDRGRVLESAWERAWGVAKLPDSMSLPFYDLWKSPKARLHAPLLFLNSTEVETGQRVIVSAVQLPPASDFYGANELITLTGADLPMSSAAHLSARFTYVSPAATVLGPDRHVVGHLVDGGYFENTGADTAAGVIKALNDAAAARAVSIAIYVLIISNEPEDPKAAKGPDPERWLTELRAPLAALLNARDARGREAAIDIARPVMTDSSMNPLGAGKSGEVLALPIGLEQRSIVLPLGWTLSDTAQCEIDEQLATALDSPSPASAVGILDTLFTVVLPKVALKPGC